MVSERLSGWIGQPGHAHDRDARLRLPAPAEVVGHAHRAGRVAGHGVDAAVGRARADREHGQRLRRQPVEPLARRHRLVGVGVVAEAAPVALALDRLVRDRALDDEHERLELAAVGLEEPLDEVVGAADRAALEVDQRPVHRDLREAGQGAERDLLDARLGRRGEGDRVAVAAQPGVDPEDVDDGLVRRGFRAGHDGPPALDPWAATLRPPSPGVPPAPGPVNECLAHPLTARRAQASNEADAQVRRHARRPGVVRSLPAGLGPRRPGPAGTGAPRRPARAGREPGAWRSGPRWRSTTSPACGPGTGRSSSRLVRAAYEQAGGPADGRALLEGFLRWAPRPTTGTPRARRGRPRRARARPGARPTATWPAPRATRSATGTASTWWWSTTTTGAGWASTAWSASSPTDDELPARRARRRSRAGPGSRSSWPRRSPASSTPSCASTRRRTGARSVAAVGRREGRRRRAGWRESSWR